MKTHFIIFFTIFSMTIFTKPATAQDSTKASTKKLYIGFTASPDLCYRSISKQGEPGSIEEANYNNHKEHNKPMFGYTAGIHVGYKFSKSLSLETGVLYSNKGYSYALFFGDQIDPRYGFVYNTSNPIEKSVIRSHFDYIDVPVSVNYYCGKKKLGFTAYLGVTMNYCVNNKGTWITWYKDGDTKRKDIEMPYDVNKFNVSPTAGAGIFYSLNTVSSITMTPSFSYGLMNTIEELNTKLWNAGLNVKYSYAFK